MKRIKISTKYAYNTTPEEHKVLCAMNFGNDGAIKYCYMHDRSVRENRSRIAILRVDDKIAAWGYCSEGISCRYNLQVWTGSRYRRRGYGRRIVLALCKELQRMGAKEAYCCCRSVNKSKVFRDYNKYTGERIKDYKDVNLPGNNSTFIRNFFFSQMNELLKKKKISIKLHAA